MDAFPTRTMGPGGRARPPTPDEMLVWCLPGSADFYEVLPDCTIQCSLCNKEATWGHVQSRKHTERMAHPDWYLSWRQRYASLPAPMGGGGQPSTPMPAPIRGQPSTPMPAPIRGGSLIGSRVMVDEIPEVWPPEPSAAALAAQGMYAAGIGLVPHPEIRPLAATATAAAQGGMYAAGMGLVPHPEIRPPAATATAAAQGGSVVNGVPLRAPNAQPPPPRGPRPSSLRSHGGTQQAPRADHAGAFAAACEASGRFGSLLSAPSAEPPPPPPQFHHRDVGDDEPPPPPPRPARTRRNQEGDDEPPPPPPHSARIIRDEEGSLVWRG